MTPGYGTDCRCPLPAARCLLPAARCRLRRRRRRPGRASRRTSGTSPDRPTARPPDRADASGQAPARAAVADPATVRHATAPRAVTRPSAPLEQAVARRLTGLTAHQAHGCAERATTERRGPSSPASPWSVRGRGCGRRVAFPAAMSSRTAAAGRSPSGSAFDRAPAVVARRRAGPADGPRGRVRGGPPVPGPHGTGARRRGVRPGHHRLRPAASAGTARPGREPRTAPPPHRRPRRRRCWGQDRRPPLDDVAGGQPNGNGVSRPLLRRRTPGWPARRRSRPRGPPGRCRVARPWR